MDTSITNNDEQQLIQMSALSPEKLAQEEKVVIVREKPTTIITTDVKPPTKAELKQQTFVLRLFSWPLHLLTSCHIPHFSDRSLRLTFLLFITLIGLTSFTIALIVGSTVVQFKQQCPLYATFNFEKLTKLNENWLLKLNPASEIFSSPSTCDFCTFSNVFTFIYCIMTGFFFILFNGDHRVIRSNDRCLIIPWFPMSIILGLLALINASMLTNGFLKFCAAVTSNDKQITSCVQLNQIVFEQYPNVSSLFIYMLIAIVGSWFQLAFFIGVVAILVIRLGSSFDWSKHHDTDGNVKPINIIMKPIEKAEKV
ncbi:unnamed protein product [Adineta ricciae]|uniref:Uncharacterized protein n=1 Tax=Adineta ricciae TaxID=249248 RepID=A0A813ZBW9_ADIRI|nr:unnamed protein product [Adineta ricciae]CAF1196759.1 unnamed protein product [Adineta ricciae]